MEESQKVSVIDIDMPFMSMVVFITKFTLAAIPAMIIVWVFFAMIGAVLGGLFGG